MVSLKVLFLHENLISDWDDIMSISGLKQLVHLTLMRNPISQIPGYRAEVVNRVGQLKAFDDYIITDEERIQAPAPLANRFKGMSNFMKIIIPKFQDNQTAEWHTFNFEVDVYRLKRLFERNSPSIRIQSFYRGYRVRS